MGTIIYIILPITAIVMTFLAIIIVAIIFFYKRRNKKEEVKPEIKQEVKPEPKKEIPREKTLGARNHSIHNNRKTSRGRKVQYVKLNERTKPIYH